MKSQKLHLPWSASYLHEIRKPQSLMRFRIRSAILSIPRPTSIYTTIQYAKTKYNCRSRSKYTTKTYLRFLVSLMNVLKSYFTYYTAYLNLTIDHRGGYGLIASSSIAYFCPLYIQFAFTTTLFFHEIKLETNEK